MTIDIEQHEWPLTVGVDIGGTQMRVAVLRGDRVLSRTSLLTGKVATPERILPLAYYAIEQVVSEANVKLEQITAIGIGVPGPINYRTGLVFSLPNLSGWNYFPLRDVFVNRFGIPSFVENDGNAATLGESLFGAGRNCRNMVYVTISTGIGGGVIVNGQLMQGESGTAAELGHITIDMHGRQCVCGNIGCLESIASGTAIAQCANEAIEQGRGNDLLSWITHTSGDGISHEKDCNKKFQQPFFLDAQKVAQAAIQGVPSARNIIKEAAIALGIGLVNIMHLFNPKLIVLGGGITQIGSLFLEPVLQIVQERAMAIPYKDVRITLAELGADSGIIGAGTLNFLATHTGLFCGK